MENSPANPYVYWRDRLVLVSLSVGLAVNIILWSVLFGKLGFPREVMPLHFNVISGIDLVGSGRQLYLLPGVGLLLYLLNFGLGRLLYREARMLTIYLSLAGAIIQVVLAVAIAALFYLNI